MANRAMKIARAAMGLSQTRLGRELDRTQGWVSAVESGRLPLDGLSAHALANVLNLPVDVVRTGEGVRITADKP